MARDCIISQQTLRAQTDMFRIACDPVRYGYTLRSISALTGISYSTIRSWAGHNGEPHEMAVSAIRKFQRAGFPNELLSLLLDEGHTIVRAPEELDHDEVADACADYLQTKHAAHHPDSPAGRDIADCEDTVLRGKFAKVRAA